MVHPIDIEELEFKEYFLRFLAINLELASFIKLSKLAASIFLLGMLLLNSKDGEEEGEHVLSMDAASWLTFQDGPHIK